MTESVGREIKLDFGGSDPFRCFLIGDAVQFAETYHTIPDYRIHLPALKNMDLDTDDVFICASAKSGTNWIWEITQMLLNGKADYHSKGKGISMLEFADIEILQGLSKPRVFNTHFSPQCLPKQVFEKKCKMIFIQRNPKDVMTSYLPFLKGHRIINQDVTFNEYFPKMLNLEVNSALFNWFYYTKTWYDFLKANQDNIDVHHMMFEDLKENPLEEITKLAKFLNLRDDNTLYKEIAEKCEFKNLKTAAAAKDFIVEDSHKFIFRKGQVGDWKNHFTVAFNEQFDEVYKEKMKGVDFKYRYSL